MTATLRHLGTPHAYGHGADLVVLGATWASVIRTRPSIGRLARRPSLGLARRPSTNLLELATRAAHGGKPAAAVELDWKQEHTKAWRTALSALGPPAKLLVRSVPETPRQTVAAVYQDFNSRVGELASEARVGLIDSFAGTWSGVRAGVMAHHDSTRIHFSDTGRAYLAQLTLNALPLVLDARGGRPGPPQAEPAGAIRLERLVSTPP